MGERGAPRLSHKACAPTSELAGGGVSKRSPMSLLMGTKASSLTPRLSHKACAPTSELAGGARQSRRDTPFFRVGSCFLVSHLFQFRCKVPKLFIFSLRLRPWPDSLVRKVGATSTGLRFSQAQNRGFGKSRREKKWCVPTDNYPLITTLFRGLADRPRSSVSIRQHRSGTTSNWATDV